MKSILLFVTLFIMSTSIYAQQIELKVNNPFSTFVFSSYTIGAEYGINAYLGVEGLARYSSITEFNKEGLSIIGSFKYYFNPNKGINKWHSGIYTKYSHIQDPSYNDDNRNIYAIGAILGYKFVTKHNVVFEWYFGFGRNYNPTATTNRLDSIGMFNVGYRFLRRKGIDYFR